MKYVIIFILVLIIIYLLNTIEKFQGSMMVPLFDINSYIEKIECSPYQKHSVNCYKQIIKKHIEYLKKGLIKIYSDRIIKKEITKLDIKSDKCYETLNDFPSGIVSNLIDFNNDTTDATDKIKSLISSKTYFNLEEVGFIQMYKAIQQNLKKYNSDKLLIVPIPDLQEIYIEDKDNCEIVNTLNNENIDTFIRQNIVKHFLTRIIMILDNIDTDTMNGTIEMYDVKILENALNNGIIDENTSNMKTISERVMASLGVVSRTVSKYYCSEYVNCCHKENCKKIQSMIIKTKSEKETGYKKMLLLYEKKHKKCVDSNKNMKKQSKLCKK